jgi:hypothetical protein
VASRQETLKGGKTAGPPFATRVVESHGKLLSSFRILLFALDGQPLNLSAVKNPHTANSFESRVECSGLLQLPDILRATTQELRGIRR